MSASEDDLLEDELLDEVGEISPGLAHEEEELDAFPTTSMIQRPTTAATSDLDLSRPIATSASESSVSKSNTGRRASKIEPVRSSKVTPRDSKAQSKGRSSQKGRNTRVSKPAGRQTATQRNSNNASRASNLTPARATKNEQGGLKISASARKALQDTEDRSQYDKDYNPVFDVLFGGWKKKPDDKHEEKKVVIRDEKRGSESESSDPTVQQSVTNVGREPETSQNLQPVITQSITTTLQQADALSPAKQTNLRRRGSVCLVEKQIDNDKNDDTQSQLGSMPRMFEKRRLSATPGLMLRRPTLEESNKQSNTRLTDMRERASQIKANATSTVNLCKQQSGVQGIGLDVKNCDTSNSGISFALNEASQMHLPVEPAAKMELPHVSSSSEDEAETERRSQPRQTIGLPAIKSPISDEGYLPNKCYVNTHQSSEENSSEQVDSEDSGDERNLVRTASVAQITESLEGRRMSMAQASGRRTSVAGPTGPRGIGQRPSLAQMGMLVAEGKKMAAGKRRGTFNPLAQASGTALTDRRSSLALSRRSSVALFPTAVQKTRNGPPRPSLMVTPDEAKALMKVAEKKSGTNLKNNNLGAKSEAGMNSRRSSFCFPTASTLNTNTESHDGSAFKNAADRIRRMSYALHPFQESGAHGGAVSMGRRQSMRGSISQVSPRFSLTPGALDSKGIDPALMNRRKSMLVRKSTSNKSNSKMNLIDVEQGLHHETMTPASEALTADQIRAFKEAFDLFDNNGGGTIDASELKDTLDSVGIEIDQDDIEEVMMQLDEDGNGEIDFEEFLNLMTNTEMFLEAFARKKNSDGEESGIHGCRDVLLFDALTEFMKKSALKAADEIVGYYAKKYKKVVKTYNMNKGAHVVGHYADGARLIGLTEKQIYRELKRLRMYSNFTKDERNSPYAQPLHLALLKTTKPKSIRPPKRVNSARSCNSDKQDQKGRHTHTRGTTPVTKTEHQQLREERERKRLATRRMSMTGQQKKKLGPKKNSSKTKDAVKEERPPSIRQPEMRPETRAEQRPIRVPQAYSQTAVTSSAPRMTAPVTSTFDELREMTPHTMTATKDNEGNITAVPSQPNILPMQRATQPCTSMSTSGIGTDISAILGKRTGKIRITMIRSKINNAERAKSGQIIRPQIIQKGARVSTAPQKRASEILPHMHKPGWQLQRTQTINIHMPLKNKWSRVPVCKLPRLRKAVKRKEKEFIKDKEKQKFFNNKQLFRVLDTRAAAYTPPLMHQFLAASAAYSCATPDNRIRMEVDELQIIQGKDAKLRDIDIKVAKKGGGDGGSIRHKGLGFQDRFKEALAANMGAGRTSQGGKRETILTEKRSALHGRPTPIKRADDARPGEPVSSMDLKRIQQKS